MKHGETQVQQDAGDGDDRGLVSDDRFWTATTGPLPGLLVIGAACPLVLYGSIRLGIGRHRDVWWRPFENALTPAHVENLAVFALGIAGIAIGVWQAASAVWRAVRAG